MFGMRSKILTAAILFMVPALPLRAKVIGTVGRTYPISERDALTEIQERAEKINMGQLLNKVKPENYRPSNLTELPRARKTRTFQVDMTYTLERDIPDGKGGVLYPAGYTFNPLDYVPFNKTLVVIDGKEREQVLWFVLSTYMVKPDVMLLITGGSTFDLEKILKRPVFYATEPIVQRFALTATPSVIRRKERVMEVEEIALQYHKTAEARK